MKYKKICTKTNVARSQNMVLSADYVAVNVMKDMINADGLFVPLCEFLANQFLPLKSSMA
jgi:hypothetical protein